MVVKAAVLVGKKRGRGQFCPPFLSPTRSRKIVRVPFSFPVYVDALVERDRDATNSGTLSERLYALQDANWNVTALMDTSGSIVERYVYDPYGSVTVLNTSWTVITSSAYASVYLHQGGRFDPAAGLYNFDYRVLSPALTRWMQSDPKQFAAHDQNLYRYEANSATARLDPSGLDWRWSGCAGGAIVGGIGGAIGGALVGGLPSWGIGALPGAVIGGGVGLVVGCVVGGFWGEDVAAWWLNKQGNQVTDSEAFWGGAVIGGVAGTIAGTGAVAGLGLFYGGPPPWLGGPKPPTPPPPL